MILVVEDNATLLKHLVRSVRGAGYEAVEALDGQEAADLGEKHLSELTLLITDLDLPRLNGVQLADRLWSLRAGLPVVFISGSLAPQVPEGPHVRFLEKPFGKRQLVAAIEELV